MATQFLGTRYQSFKADGTVNALGTVQFFEVNSATHKQTYSNSSLTTENADPVVLDSGGCADIWYSGNADVTVYDSDGVLVDTFEDINPTELSEWVDGPEPTYVSTTSFTLIGDQTSTFHVGRRVKTTNTGGTIYSTISIVAYTSLTTVTVVNDSGTLDSGLSHVQYGNISAVNTSMPATNRIPASTVDGATNYATASGTNTYTATLIPALLSLVNGAEYNIKFTNASTSTTPTLSLNSLGAKTIKRPDGSALQAGDISATGQHKLRYDGTDLILLNPVHVTPSEYLQGTPTVDTATAGTSTTQIASTEFVLQNSNISLDEYGTEDLLVEPYSGDANASVLVTATKAIVKTSSDAVKRLTNITSMARLSQSGVSGLDTGSEANNTHYAVWLISKVAPIAAAAVAVDNTTDTITHTAHGMAANTPIQFAGTAIPAGLSASTTYYIRDVLADTYAVAAFPGNTAINITDNGTAVTVTEQPAIVFSTSYTAPTLPSGYTYYLLIGNVRNNASSNIIAFRQGGRTILYTAAQAVLTNGVATSETAITLTGVVPSIAKQICLFHENAGINFPTSVDAMSYRVVSGTNFVTINQGVQTSVQYNSMSLNIPNIGRTLYYIITGTYIELDTYVTGYTI